MERGRRLAVDVGTVRIGLAISDPDSILSSPLPATRRAEVLENTLKEIVNLATEQGVIEIYVGDPLSLSGNETASTKDARAFAEKLAELVNAPVRLVDERLTTVSAAAKLRQNGMNARQSKSLIDSASAVEILEQALNVIRSSGVSPGDLVGGQNA